MKDVLRQDCTDYLLFGLTLDRLRLGVEGCLHLLSHHTLTLDQRLVNLLYHRRVSSRKVITAAMSRELVALLTQTFLPLA